MPGRATAAGARLAPSRQLPSDLFLADQPACPPETIPDPRRTT